MAEKKLFKRDYFGMLRIVVSEADISEDTRLGLTDFIDNELALLDRKSEGKKETKTQKANTAIKATVLEVLKGWSAPVTVSALMEDSRLATYEEETKDGPMTIKMSNQKLSSMLSQLVKEGFVVKSENKKKSYFSLASYNDIIQE